jgi:hypothetical protein
MVTTVHAPDLTGQPVYDPELLLHEVRCRLQLQGVIPPGYPEDTPAAVEACRQLLLAEHIVPAPAPQLVAPNADPPKPPSQPDVPWLPRVDSTGLCQVEGWVPYGNVVYPPPKHDPAVERKDCPDPVGQPTPCPDPVGQPEPRPTAGLPRGGGR